MSKLDMLDEEIRSMKRAIKSCEHKQMGIIRAMKLDCPCCKTTNQLRQFTFVQVFVREPRSERTEGADDLPLASDKCRLLCPACGDSFEINRSERARNIAMEWMKRMIPAKRIFRPAKYAEADLGYRGIPSIRKPKETVRVH